MVANGVDQMRQLLEQAGLSAPPIPDPFTADLTECDKWFYSTRKIERGKMYSPPRYAAEVVAHPVEDYVALSHVGHGINSYEIVYHLVYGQLAVFTGTGWGGGYMDSDKASAAVRKQFQQCTELVKLFETVRRELPSPPHRLVVIEEEFSGWSVCEWLPAPLGSSKAASEWIQSRPKREKDAVSAAIDALRERQRQLRLL